METKSELQIKGNILIKNLFFALFIFIFLMSILAKALEMDNTYAIFISGIVALYDALIQSRIDYLEREVKNLKNNTTK